MKYPVYKLVLKDEEDGVDFVSLVDDPAIERDWQAFSKSRPKRIFQVADGEKRIIQGAIMIANLPIYRLDFFTGEESFAIFDKKTIEQTVQRFFKNGFGTNVNMMHDEPVEGVYLIESWITSRARGLGTPEGYGALPDGSWFGSFKVDNEELWQDFIKTGKLKGFSVEGWFQRELHTALEDKAINKIIEVLQNVS